MYFFEYCPLSKHRPAPAVDFRPRRGSQQRSVLCSGTFVDLPQMLGGSQCGRAPRQVLFWVAGNYCSGKPALTAREAPGAPANLLVIRADRGVSLDFYSYSREVE